MRKDNLLIIAVGVALVFIIYFFGKTTADIATGADDAISQAVDFKSYEELQLAALPEEDAAVIQQLQSQIAVNPSLENHLALSASWEKMGSYPLGAYYFYEAAGIDSDSITWEAAGDKLLNSYKNYGDSLITNNLVNFAVASYSRANEADESSIQVQMKLAEAYVESPEPMKGIVILREIADSLPDYIPAQMTLGRLSLQTGQYDKARERFQNILRLSPTDTEALYFLALANEGLGNIEETIRLLETCKLLVGNPAFTEEIDAYIDKLKN